jgi:dynein heavy chain
VRDRKKVGGKASAKAKPKFKSYAEARKDREKFRKKLVRLGAMICASHNHQVELIMHRSGDEDEDAEPENCAAPLTCKEKDLLRYYYYIHNGIATKYVAGMSQEWFQRIMNLVPK